MPKIIQLLQTDEESLFRGALLGLGNDGVTYELDKNRMWAHDRDMKWIELIPKLDIKEDK